MAVTETPSGDRCQVCGGPVRVRILEDYVAGKPVYSWYCMACADEHEHDHVVVSGGPEPRRYRVTMAMVMVIGGAAMGMAGVFAQSLGITVTTGFGWYQQAGVVAGGFLVLLGALLRIDAVAVLGTVLFGLAACTDVIGLGGATVLGFGQQLSVAVGLAVMAIGLAWHHAEKVRQRRHASEMKQKGCITENAADSD